MDDLLGNKQAAVNFLQLVIDHKIDLAFQTYVDMHGKHHNAYTPAGFAALRQGMIDNDEKAPIRRFDVKLVIQEGDLVSVFSHIVFDTSEMSAVHTFRFEEGKIIEFWDCAMVLPPNSPNQDGAF